MPTDESAITYQFDVPQGPISEKAWLAYSLGTAAREELDRREERGYKHGDGEQTKLVTDGGRPNAGREAGRGGPQKPSDHIYTGKDEDLISYLARESINWTYHHRYSEHTVEEPFMEMVAYCLATYHDGLPITPKAYVTNEVEHGC